MTPQVSVLTHDASPAGAPPVRRRAAWAAPVLTAVQLAILAGFAWELEPLFYRPVQAEVLSLSYETRWISTSRRRHSVGTDRLRPARFPLVDYRYVVNGAPHLGSVISRHPFEEWKARYTRPLRGKAAGSRITAYVAPWAPGRALLVRTPNGVILFILAVALFFASVLSLAARTRSRRA